jgi:hypothetical protein
MNTRGLVDLIVLDIGRDVGILLPTLITMLVITAVLTTAMTSPALSLVTACATLDFVRRYEQHVSGLVDTFLHVLRESIAIDTLRYPSCRAGHQHGAKEYTGCFESCELIGKALEKVIRSFCLCRVEHDDAVTVGHGSKRTLGPFRTWFQDDYAARGLA